MEQGPGFQLVVACTQERGIGLDGGMPWTLRKDMAYFKALTSTARDATSKRNAVIMGRKTWDSIPKKFRPLANRFNVVISRSMEAGTVAEAGVSAPDAVADSLEAALSAVSAAGEGIETVFVIGGASIYADAIQSPRCEALHVTELHAAPKCDTFFPEIDPAVFRLWSCAPTVLDGDQRITMKCYVRPSAGIAATLPPAMNSRHEEYQYLDLIKEVMETGSVKGDRTGTGTISLFAKSMRFNLEESFPLLTTKRTFWRGVAEELLWFISGSTNAKLLADKGVHIWDGNGSRDFLDSRGLPHREVMDLGPVYGFQWRHFGAEYTDMHADYTGKGVDQLADVIHKIKTDPNDRRLIISAWNPAALHEMALPPCHMFCQFYVSDGKLSCQMYQRSCDLGLGVPFNIASYALLTRLIAQVCDLRVGEFVHVMGDAHVYSNHVEALREQLLNEPRAFSTLHINPAVKDIDAFTMTDLEIRGYEPHKKIAMVMAV